MNPFKSKDASLTTSDEPYAKQHSLEYRIQESQRMLSKYPDRIPCIVETVKNAPFPPLTKKKFLIPHTHTVEELISVIRKRVQLTEHQALFVFVNNVIPPTSSTIVEVYSNHKGEDGFLTFYISGENTFGTESTVL